MIVSVVSNGFQKERHMKGLSEEEFCKGALASFFDPLFLFKDGRRVSVQSESSKYETVVKFLESGEIGVSYRLDGVALEGESKVLGQFTKGTPIDAELLSAVDRVELPFDFVLSLPSEESGKSAFPEFIEIADLSFGELRIALLEEGSLVCNF